MSRKRPDSRNEPNSNGGDVVRDLINAIRSVRFGRVQIYVRDSRVVQIHAAKKPVSE